MDASAWDDRYAATDLVWSAGPNQFVADRLGGRSPTPGAVAVDLAAGEGRNALWLARQGWTVVAVDFSQVALDKGRRVEAADPPGVPVEWVCGDARSWRPEAPVDLVVVAYLHLEPEERRAAFRNAWTMLAPGGDLLVVAHDSSNLEHGTGGPQDAAVLFTPEDVLADIAPGDEDEVLESRVIERRVPSPVADGHHEHSGEVGAVALDALVHVRRR